MIDTDTETAVRDQGGSAPPDSGRSHFERRLIAIGAVLIVLAGFLGWFIAQPREESFNVVDDGFLADMTDHHQGAINLS